MPQALITINAVAGSNTDLPINTLVQLNNQGIGGETTYNWTIVDQPAGATDSLSSTTIANPTFTPKKEGTYLLRLVVNQGTGSEVSNTAVAAVRQLKTRTRIPAAQEKTEADANEGWSASLAAIFQLVDSIRADPALAVGQAGAGGLVAGSVLRISGEATIKSGLPGQEIVPLFVAATSDTPANCRGDLFLLVSGVDGSTTPANGALLLTRRLGLYAGVSGLNQAVGTEVFLTDAGGISQTPGTVRRRVGVVVAQSANSDIHFDAYQADTNQSGAVAMQLGKAGAVQLKPASWSSFGTSFQTVLDAMAVGSIALGYQGAVLSGYTNQGTGAAVSVAVVDPQAVSGAHLNFGFPSGRAIFNGASGVTLQQAFTTVLDATTTAIICGAPIQLKDATAYQTVVSYSSGFYVFGPGGTTDSAMLTGKNVELLASSGNSITLNFGTLQPFTFQSAQCTVGSGDNTATPASYTFQGASASSLSNGNGASITWAAGLKDGTGVAGAHIWKTSNTQRMQIAAGVTLGIGTFDPGAGSIAVDTFTGTTGGVMGLNATRTGVLHLASVDASNHINYGDGATAQTLFFAGSQFFGESSDWQFANTAGNALFFRATATAQYFYCNGVESARFQQGLSVGTATDAGSGGVRIATSLQLVSTDNSGTPGANTANTPSGRCKIAAGASSVVVTNSTVAATSHVFAQISQSAADATLTQVVRTAPGAGSFTIVGNANATAATQVDWWVINI